jgi:hypothetical protein
MFLPIGYQTDSRNPPRPLDNSDWTEPDYTAGRRKLRSSGAQSRRTGGNFTLESQATSYARGPVQSWAKPSFGRKPAGQARRESAKRPARLAHYSRKAKPAMDLHSQSFPSVSEARGSTTRCASRYTTHFYFPLSLTASPIRIVPPNTMSARNPPRCKSPVRTPFVVSASRYWQGSHKRFPISRTEPTWNSRPTK